MTKEHAYKLMKEAALKHRCWQCESKPGHTCTEDHYDTGITAVSPHTSRIIDGAQDVIVDLLRRL